MEISLDGFAFSVFNVCQKSRKIGDLSQFSLTVDLFFELYIINFVDFENKYAGT